APPDKAKQTEPPKHWRAFAVRLSPDGRVLEKLWVVLPRGQIFVIQPSAKEVRQIITGTHSWLSSASFPAINAKGIKVVGATNRVEVTIRVHEINATSLKVISATMGDWLFTDVPVPPVPPPSAGAADDVSFAPHPSPMRIETQNTDG
ncbi:MAG: hypothetical protein HY269_03530, partial [Deltaproteobacteria bacterium]|nr:hypothetical protein [Deltaproteobacteria bacterium]